MTRFLSRNPRHQHDDDVHDDFGGLHRDLAATGAKMNRRNVLRLAARYGAGIGALSLLGCKTGSDVTGTDGSNGTRTKIPTETAGPYPADSSNGPSVLNLTGVVRNDIRSSFAGLTGTTALSIAV